MANRRWGVSQKHCRCSAFDGYQVMYSDYSAVHCLECGAVWRTKANFVETLPNVIAVRTGWQFTSPQAERGGTL